jgi:hypothetical protein
LGPPVTTTKSPDLKMKSVIFSHFTRQLWGKTKLDNKHFKDDRAFKCEVFSFPFNLRDIAIENKPGLY